ncbi:tRNA (cytidine(34)-2'-O)-methyltransferase [Rhodobacteraceae bacterium]|jgi:tRNA (cytidine/uridine-2'-O-)-methyltransferase|nr:tRNA (cytidine(34)-2'-O)-methyltransferase [Paracoccaceae bacterium]
MLTKKDSLLLKIVLFQPEIAQNMGAIVRLCACFGISLGVIEPCGFPFSSKALKRAMMDYGELNDVEKYINFQKYFDQKKVQNSESRMILLTTKGEECLWDFKFSACDHLFFGNEGHGVPNSVAIKSDAKVYIPMQGGGRSLNLSISAGIALGEATRQLEKFKS